MGYKVSDIQAMSLSKIMSMSREDLANATRVLVRESNKRLTNMRKRGLTTPATAYIKKHGGKFRVKTRSGKEKNVAQLREEFQRAKGFLESETSTVKGFRAWETKVTTTLEEQTATYTYNEKGEKIKVSAGIDYNSLSETQKRRFWQVYAKLEETDQANVHGGNYRTSIKEIYDAVKTGLRKSDIDAFVIDLNNQLYDASKKDFKGAFNLLEG